MDPRLGPSAARLALGLLTAPFAVPLFHAAIEVGRASVRDAPPGFVAGLLRAAPDLALTWTLPLSYGSALALGIPIVLGLRPARLLRALPVLALSVACGALAASAAVLLLPPSVGDEPIWTLWLAAGVGGALGGAVSTLFCLVAGIRWRKGSAATT